MPSFGLGSRNLKAGGLRRNEQSDVCTWACVYVYMLEAGVDMGHSPCDGAWGWDWVCCGVGMVENNRERKGKQ